MKDLVEAVFLAIDRGVSRRAYFVTDGKVYTAHDFGNIVRQELGNPFVCRITVPLWLGRVAALLCDAASMLTRQTFTLNSDKYRILSQRNWTTNKYVVVNGYRRTTKYLYLTQETYDKIFSEVQE